jgi:hypothetical protein
MLSWGFATSCLSFSQTLLVILMSIMIAMISIPLCTAGFGSWMLLLKRVSDIVKKIVALSIFLVRRVLIFEIHPRTHNSFATPILSTWI